MNRQTAQLSKMSLRSGFILFACYDHLFPFRRSSLLGRRFYSHTASPWLFIQGGTLLCFVVHVLHRAQFIFCPVWWMYPNPAMHSRLYCSVCLFFLTTSPLLIIFPQISQFQDSAILRHHFASSFIWSVQTSFHCF